MTRTATRLLITIAFAAAGTTAAGAQLGPGSAAPLPGTGDSTKISQGNRDNNAAYNQLIGAGNDRPKKDDRAQAHTGAVRATAADVKPGAALRDSAGVSIGTVASIDGDGVVVDTGQSKIRVPLEAFGKDDKGLLLGITAAKFNQLVAQAHAKSQAQSN
jgi:hypothetical protein